MLVEVCVEQGLQSKYGITHGALVDQPEREKKVKSRHNIICVSHKAVKHSVAGAVLFLLLVSVETNCTEMDTSVHKILLFSFTCGTQPGPNPLNGRKTPAPEHLYHQSLMIDNM